MRHIIRSLIAASALLCLGAAATAQPCSEGWLEVSSDAPSRSESPLVYDAARQQVLRFGGRSGSTRFNDTWLWNGEQWTQLTVPGPSARSGHALAYDSARQRVVLFGGRGAAGLLGDTWEWNGAEWAQASSTGPVAREFAAMTYDVNGGSVLLFGGGDPTQVPVVAHADTWLWDGEQWTSSTASGPDGRWNASMASNPLAKNVLLAGGYTRLASQREFHDIWLWSDGQWQAHYLPNFNEMTTSTTVIRTLFFNPILPAMQRAAVNGVVQTWTGGAWADFSLSSGQNVAVDEARNLAVAQSGASTREWDMRTQAVRVLSPLTPSTIDRAHGESTVISTVISPGPPSTFQWLFNGAPMVNGNGAQGVTTQSLTLNPIGCHHEGVFQLRVTTPSCGTPPSFSGEVTLGLRRPTGSIAFTHGQGSEPFTLTATAQFPQGVTVRYQWLRNGVALFDDGHIEGGQLPVLRVHQPWTQADNGLYEVVLGPLPACVQTIPPGHLVDLGLCAGDANGDGLVNFADLNIVLSQFGQAGAGLQGDVNDDGVVNFADLNVVLSNFGAVC